MNRLQMIDLTHFINFHQEGELAEPSIASAIHAQELAQSNGLSVHLIALLDASDAYTKDVVSRHNNFAKVIEVEFRDLGKARNLGAEEAISKYISFQDGDDLIGKNWLINAIRTVSDYDPMGNSAIVHPEYALYFYEREYSHDFAGHRQSFFMKYTSSISKFFDPLAIAFNNIYTSNFLSSKELVVENKIPEKDEKNNWGVEDWTWNSQTLARGYSHLVAKDTVHAVRVKTEGSLGLENVRKGYLPDTREYLNSLKVRE
jgi:Glycosyl transferase family 2